MKRIVVLTAAILAMASISRAQDIDKEFFFLPDSITDEYLDTLKLQTVKTNDYWIAGFYGGASMQYGFFNPSRLVRWQVQYPVYGFSIVKYFTMFGIYPNMGLEFGAQQNYEGYEFKENKQTGYRSTESGAYKTLISVPEAFLLSHFHMDVQDRFKLMAKIGIYFGYRESITRVLQQGYESYSGYIHEFRDYDNRLSYGVQGGVGTAIMLDPFELHLDVRVKWGWSSYWQPDSAPKFYFRFAYPLDVNVTFGLYYQLSPRHGHSRAALKQMAREIVNSSK